MKKTCFILMIVSLVFSMTGCASKPPAPVQSGPTSTPEWLNDLPSDDVIWGIGVAKQSSVNLSMTTAEARARTAVARQLDTLVQAMFTDYNIDAGTAGNQANASMQEDVSRQITDINLSGAKPIKRWEAPDGTWWYLVEYKKSEAKSAIASILNNEEALYAQFKAQQALGILDAKLSKNEKPQRVDQ